MTHHLTLVRHGLSVANRERIVQGQADYPLSQEGRRQAEALAAHWTQLGVNFDVIISSPLLRARQTTEILAERLGASFEQDPCWMERHWGHAQGLPYDEVRDQFLHESRGVFDHIFETGESDWEIYQRAADGLRTLLSRPAGRYLIVSHGGLLNYVMRIVATIPPAASWSRSVRFHFDNCSTTRIRFDPAENRWTLEALNDRSHLDV
jgi:broad specificity phosphatase PhoE